MDAHVPSPTVFQSGHTVFPSRRMCTRVFIPPPPTHIIAPLLLLSWPFAIPGGREGILIAISLMTNHREQVSMCLLAICESSLEKCLFKSFAPLKMWLHILWSFKGSLFILDINPVSSMWFANTFSQLWGLSFRFDSDKIQLIIFFFHAFGAISKKFLPKLTEISSVFFKKAFRLSSYVQASSPTLPSH